MPPTSIRQDVAAAFTLATLTAWRMVVTRARVRAGEHVLIWGIGGGVALAALADLQADRRPRLGRDSGSDEKLERAKALGADESINRNAVDVGQRDARAHGEARRRRRRGQRRRGDVGAVARRLGRRGRLVTCGGTSGPMVETDVRRLFWNQWSDPRLDDGERRRVRRRSRGASRRTLMPPVDSVYALDDGRAAFERLAGGEHFGKVVIRVS